MWDCSIQGVKPSIVRINGGHSPKNGETETKIFSASEKHHPLHLLTESAWGGPVNHSLLQINSLTSQKFWLSASNLVQIVHYTDWETIHSDMKGLFNQHVKPPITVYKKLCIKSDSLAHVQGYCICKQVRTLIFTPVWGLLNVHSHWPLKQFSAWNGRTAMQFVKMKCKAIGNAFICIRFQLERGREWWMPLRHTMQCSRGGHRHQTPFVPLTASPAGALHPVFSPSIMAPHTRAHIPSGQHHRRSQSGFIASLWLHRLSGPAGDTHIYKRTYPYTLQCTSLKYIMQRALSNIHSLMTSLSRREPTQGEWTWPTTSLSLSLSFRGVTRLCQHKPLDPVKKLGSAHLWTTTQNGFKRDLYWF